MPALRALFAAGSFIHSASSLAQHPVHRASPSTHLVEAQGLDSHDEDAKHHHHLAVNQSHSDAPASLWTACSKVNAFDGWKPIDDKHCLDANLVLIRIFKTGTSSMGGVLRRIGARYGLNGIEEKIAVGLPEPLVSTDHFPMSHWKEIWKGQHFVKQSVLVSLVRDPVERWLSNFYYRISKGIKQCPCDLLEFMQEFAQPKANFQLNYLRRAGQVENKPDENISVDQLLNSYPLIGISERFDDTVVVLMFLLGIDSYCDVLYIDSKVSTNGGLNKRGEHYLPNLGFDKQPENVKKYIKSAEFQQSIAEDQELWEKANKRLNQQIEAIGKAKFMRRRSEYRMWLTQAQGKCADDVSGYEGCYYDDIGCKHKCLDNFCAAHGDKMMVKDNTEPLWHSRHLFHSQNVEGYSR